MLALTAVAAMAVVGFFWLLFRNDEKSWGIESAYALADGNLLLVERQGLDNNTYDGGRLRIVARSGQELRRSEPVTAAMRPIALVDGGIWIVSHDGGLELWTLSDLAPRPGAKAALDATPALVRWQQTRGTHEGALVLIGTDGRQYTFDSGYHAERQAKDFHPTLPQGIPHALVQSMALDDTELVRPSPIAGPRGTGLVLDGGASMLILSSSADGLQNAATVSRVDAGGTVRWSVTSQQLLAPHELSEPVYSTFPFIDVADGGVFVVAQATSIQSSSSDSGPSRTWGEHHVRLVDLDAEDGRVLASRAIVVPE